jgi:hypothetical protein
MCRVQKRPEEMTSSEEDDGDWVLGFRGERGFGWNDGSPNPSLGATSVRGATS